ncbi:MAG: AbrB/MazE/SpoVT family DNA-binding domain-containing protein [Clostridia bacterium]|nr:AbrB/MazE/SpoVT family DNA-binding domain-containing protein [Clostridia bacterium]
MIIRKIDSEGRIVLPSEIRNELDLKEKDKVEIHFDGEKIKIVKYKKECIFCGKNKNLKEYKGKNICHDCWRDIC